MGSIITISSNVMTIDLEGDIACLSIARMVGASLHVGIEVADLPRIGLHDFVTLIKSIHILLIFHRLVEHGENGSCGGLEVLKDPRERAP
jgi:hypothetical protein